MVESDSSVSTSQFESVEDSSTFEEKVSATSSPKKRNKKSRKKDKSSRHSNTEISDSLKTKEDSTKTTKTVTDNVDNQVSDNVIEKGQTEIKVDEKTRVDISANEKNRNFEIDTQIWNDEVAQIDNICAKTKENIPSEIKDLQKNASSKSVNNVEKLNSKVSESEGASQVVTENFNEKEKPRITQGTLLERDATPVIVSEIINPWCFYVQRCCTSLNGLMEEIWLVIILALLEEQMIFER